MVDISSKNLQERILSLENHLQDKQYIIERLFDWPRHYSPNITTSPYINPNGIKSYAPPASALKEQKQELARMHAAETKPIESAKEACNKNINNKDERNQRKQPSNTKSKQPKKVSKKDHNHW